MLDLVLPLECGGCGAPSTRWCAACARELELTVDAPRVITPRIDPGVPVFALGRYAGARRRAIVAMKDPAAPISLRHLPVHLPSACTACCCGGCSMRR